jgi:hypothetical protein
MTDDISRMLALRVDSITVSRPDTAPPRRIKTELRRPA